MTNAGVPAKSAPRGFDPRARVPWLRIVFHELKPYPGRGWLALRMTVAVVIAIALTLYVQVPFLQWLPPYLCIALSKPSKSETAVGAMGAAVLICLVVLLGLGLLHWVIEPTWLRCCALAAVVFGGLFLGRIAPKTEELAHMLSICFALVLTIPDQFPFPGFYAEAAFWLVPMGFIGAGATLVSAALIPGDKPFDELRAELCRRLLPLADVASPGSRVKPESAKESMSDRAAPPSLSRIWTLVDRAFADTPGLKAADWDVRAVVSQVDRLALLGRALTPLLNHPLSPADAGRLRGVCAAAREVRHALTDGRVPELDRYVDQRAGGAASSSRRSALLSELEATVAELERAFGTQHAHLLDAADAPSLVAPGAMRDARHYRFAIKGTVAALCVYWIYTAWELTEIHTALVTCLIVARSTDGAIMHKMTLRIAGALTGALLATLATLYWVPLVSSLWEFCVMMAVATAVASWVASSSERIAYAGWQIGVALFMMLMHSGGPSDDWSVLGGRLVGILLGNVAMATAFRWIWPERSSSAMWTRLGDVLFSLARLVEVPLMARSQAEMGRLEANERRAWGLALDDVIRDLESAVFEPGAFTREGRLARAQVRDVLERALTAFPTLNALSSYRDPDISRVIPDVVRQEGRAYHRQLARVLRELGRRVNGESPQLPARLGQGVEQAELALQSAVRTIAAGDVRSRLAQHQALWTQARRSILGLVECEGGISQKPWSMGAV